MIFDSHTHVYSSKFEDDREAMFLRARDAGVTRMLVVGTNVESSRIALEYAHKHEHIWASVGIHPCDVEADGNTPNTLAAIAEMAKDERCVAVGESGLDYYWDSVPRAHQMESLRWHLELSRAVQKPIVIHCRDAHEDTARILAEGFAEPGHPRGVMHCFTMGPDELVAYAAMDMYISFSGVVTYPKNKDNRAAAELVAADRILVETDCPYLPPQPWRGKRNEPAYVAEVVNRLSEVRSTSIQDFAHQTTQNALRLFGI